MLGIVWRFIDMSNRNSEYAYLTMQQSQRHSVIIYNMENDFVNLVKSLANQYWVLIGKVSYINV